MSTPRRPGPVAPDAAGAGSAWRPAWPYLVAALALGGVWMLLTLGDAAPEAPPAPEAATPSHNEVVSAPSPAVGASARPLTVAVAASSTHPAVDRPDPHDLAAHVPPGQAPSMGEVIQRLNQAGIHTGLGAFNPPGTSPPLIGLAVPPDFPLPDGYVRHHQTTDDGQDIEPILMFAPDRTFYDGANRPIALPADRVVPPEWAPPGMPIRRIVVPPPLRTGSAGS